MELSLFLAKLFGIFMVLIPFAMILNKDGFDDLFKTLSKSSEGLMFAGFFRLMAGLAIVLGHNIWVQDWTVLITVFGWLMIASGLTLLINPAFVQRKMAKLDAPGPRTCMLLFTFLVGLYLMYQGFVG